MRIRKIEIDLGKGKKAIDFRNAKGMALPAFAIVGNCGSNKTLMMQAAMHLFQASSRSANNTMVLSENVSATVEMEYDGAIHVGTIVNGRIAQKPRACLMRVGDGAVSDGCLFYDIKSRFHCLGTSNLSMAGATAGMLLQDLYRNEIRNSVIWVDDFDLGMDVGTCGELLRVCLRKALERDNQLIVAGRHKEMFASLGETSVKFLHNDVNIVEAMMRALK